MIRPKAAPRDYTDKHLRRVAKVLRYRGKFLPLSTADLLIHASRPGESTLLRYDNETRREAAARLRQWAFPLTEGVPRV